MHPIIKGATFIPRKVWNYTKSINTLLMAPTGITDSTERAFTYMTNLLGSTSGSAQAAIGTVDACEALACRDGICFVISCIGVGADSLQIIASFVPGPNVTTLVTLPVSTFCKTFVRMCKNKTLPWKNVCIIISPLAKQLLFASILNDRKFISSDSFLKS